MTGGLAGPSTQCAHDRPSLPDPVGHADHGQNAVWMGWSQPSLSEFAAAVPAQPETGPWFGEGLATRQAGDVLLGGASGADSLLLNTKASQEAACSRAPAAIVPGQKPESRDTGVSLFAENGHTWQRRMPRRAMPGMWAIQVAAEMPKTAHTWRRPQRAWQEAFHRE